MQSEYEALSDELERAGLQLTKPLWLQYQDAIKQCNKDIQNTDDDKELKALQTKLKSIKALFLDVYHTKVADTYPHLLFEIGEDNFYWMYNEETGLYETMNVSTVRGVVLRLVMHDGITVTTSWVKECLARYRAEYENRGHHFEDFDCTDNLLHVENGWLDIVKYELMPHTPEILSLGKANVAYDKKATCPKYDALFEQWEFTPDQVQVLHEFSGYILTPEISFAKMLVLEGEPGTGKSLLANLWTHMLADLAVREHSLEAFTDNPRFCRFAFTGKRVIWFNETDPKRSQLGSSMQKMIDGKTFQVERKIVNGFTEHANVSKNILTTNGLPSNMDAGMESRILYIKYKKIFRDSKEENVKLFDELIAESSGVLNRMIEGLKMLREQGKFSKIENQGAIMDEYRRTISLPIEFIEVYFEPVEDKNKETFISNKILNETFRAYVHDRPGYFDSPEKFSKEVLKNAPRNFKETIGAERKNGLRGMIGLRLQSGCTFSGSMIIDNRQYYGPQVSPLQTTT